MTQPHSPLHLLIPFCDDSTLIFATRMRALLRKASSNSEVTLACYLPETVLSARQLEMLLPSEDFTMLDRAALVHAATSGAYDAILTSRVYRPLTELLNTPAFIHKPARARIIAFLGGLDFFPEQGLTRRQNCDAVYLFPRAAITEFRHLAPEVEIGFGHPSFLRPDPIKVSQRNPQGDIYFFAQAISPSSRRGRRHMLRIMSAIARAHPDRRVWIKLRHLPDENQQHLHREKHDYPSLFTAEFSSPPPNLALTACTMDEALTRASLGITCTSTAAIDLIREGVPTMVYLDYVDNYIDPLVAPMRGLFSESGLITPLLDLLNLHAHPPSEAWTEAMFCPRDLGADVLDRVARICGHKP